ncbi:Olfactory Receptor 7A17 [Manis pentadactyla]|nr:Olfactory Receptor 7A17 [Manis pentadactyla]
MEARLQSFLETSFFLICGYDHASCIPELGMQRGKAGSRTAPLLFGLFLSLYLVTILGNMPIILAVSSDPLFHNPMYFFLCNLSLADISVSTITIPKMLVNIQTQNQHITYTGCIAQVCFVLDFIGFESCLLAAVAYDSYVAICQLRMYTVVMNPQLCALLFLLSLLFNVVNTLLHSLMVLYLSCTNRKIPHFFCELSQVIKLPALTPSSITS